MLQPQLNHSIRPATDADLPRIEALCEEKRVEYQGYSPLFWNKASDSSALHLEYLKRLIKHDDVFFLVVEHRGNVEGFLIAAMTSPPPVYNPGGKVCLVDDYNVASSYLWGTAGKALLVRAWEEAQQREARLLVVVCGQRDVPKRTMLQNANLEVASEWFVGIPK